MTAAEAAGRPASAPSGPSIGSGVHGGDSSQEEAAAQAPQEVARVDTKSYRRLMEDMKRRGWQLLVGARVVRGGGRAGWVSGCAWSLIARVP
mgnify:CR=1 FL=1